jgi:cell division protein FtsL
MKGAAWILIAAALTLASAVQLVVSRHETRRLFIELEALRDTEARLDEEWGQLLLEEATLATHSRVEKIARDELKMLNPPPGSVIGARL